jgi:hypothetical protein
MRSAPDGRSATSPFALSASSSIVAPWLASDSAALRQPVGETIKKNARPQIRNGHLFSFSRKTIKRRLPLSLGERARPELVEGG